MLLQANAGCLLRNMLTLSCSLQKLSLFSCACAFTASPIIMYMSSASTMGAKASIAVTLCGFGAFTTGSLVHTKLY